MTPNDPLGNYLTRFQSALVGMTIEERQDIVGEIAAHVRDRCESGMSMDEAIVRLGPAEDLAREYCRGALVRRAGVLVRRASGAFNPWLILRAAFAWAMTGLHGVGVFLTALFGYTLGVSFVLCGLAKVFFPAKAGLWVGPDTFAFGFRPENGPAREWLGQWFEPVTFGLGALFLIGTTMAMRAILPRFKYWRASALRPTGSAR